MLLANSAVAAGTSPRTLPAPMPAAGACPEAIFVPYPSQQSTTACQTSQAIIVIPYTAPAGTRTYTAYLAAASGGGRVALTVNGYTAFADVPVSPATPLTLTVNYTGPANYVNVTSIAPNCPGGPQLLEGLRLYSSQ